MAVTAIADVIVPQVLADMVSAKFPDQLVLGRTSFVNVNADFPLGTPGTEFEIPFWKRIAQFGVMSEGNALVPDKIGAGKEYALIQRAGAAYEVYDTAALVTAADPMGEISSQISRRAAEYLDGALVTELEKTPNVVDISGTGAGTMGADSFISALVTTLGDNHTKLLQNGAVIMHSKVYGDLVKLAAIQNMYQGGMDVLKSGFLGMLNGLPVMVSDRCGVTTSTPNTFYHTYIVGPEALGLFYQRQVMVEFDRDILYQADIVAATVHFATHLYGWDDKTNAQAAEDAKSILAVKILSK